VRLDQGSSRIGFEEFQGHRLDFQNEVLLLQQYPVDKLPILWNKTGEILWINAAETAFIVDNS
jgi:hypothetical protein